MADTFSFRWEGNDNPNDPSGVALFTVGSESVSIPFNNFSQAGKLRGLIEKACERSKHRAIERTVDLIRKWNEEAATAPMADQRYIATQAARWGADQELEACCEWLKAKEWIHPEFSDELRDARRPKPPSLKEQALETLSRISKDEYPCSYQDDKDWETIRRALEQLDD